MTKTLGRKRSNSKRAATIRTDNNIPIEDAALRLIDSTSASCDDFLCVASSVTYTLLVSKWDVVKGSSDDLGPTDGHSLVCGVRQYLVTTGLKWSRVSVP